MEHERGKEKSSTRWNIRKRRRRIEVHVGTLKREGKRSQVHVRTLEREGKRSQVHVGTLERREEGVRCTL